MKQSAVSLYDIYRLYMPPENSILHDNGFLAGMMRRVIGKTAQMLEDVGSQLILKYALPPTGESHIYLTDFNFAVALGRQKGELYAGSPIQCRTILAAFRYIA